MQLRCLESKAISHGKALLSKEASTSTNTKASLAQRSAVNDFFGPEWVVFVFFRVLSFTQKKKKKVNSNITGIILTLNLTLPV
jgi:hypothetical protein